MVRLYNSLIKRLMNEMIMIGIEHELDAYLHQEEHYNHSANSCYCIVA